MGTVETVAGPQALVLDDDADTRWMIEHILRTVGWVTTGAATLNEARTALAQETFQLCVVDVYLPDGDGRALLPDIVSASGAVLVISGVVDAGGDVLGTASAAFLAKPFGPRELLAAVSRLQPPRYAFRTASLEASALASSASTMRPLSIT